MGQGASMLWLLGEFRRSGMQARDTDADPNP